MKLSALNPHGPFGLTFLAFLASGCLARAVAGESAHNFDKWEKEIAGYEQSDRTNSPPQEGILFIGSSTIRLWKSLAKDFPQHRVVNRGFGGSEIVDSTHFAERLIFPHRPRMV